MLALVLTEEVAEAFRFVSVLGEDHGAGSDDDDKIVVGVDSSLSLLAELDAGALSSRD